MGTTLHNRLKYYKTKHIVGDANGNRDESYGGNIGHRGRLDINQNNNNTGNGLNNIIINNNNNNNNSSSKDILYDDIDIPINYYIIDDVSSSPDEIYPSPRSQAQPERSRTTRYRNSNLQMKSRGTQVSLPQVGKDTNRHARSDLSWHNDIQDSSHPNWMSPDRFNYDSFSPSNLDECTVNNVNNSISNSNYCNNNTTTSNTRHIPFTNNLSGYQYQLQPDYNYNSSHGSSPNSTVPCESYDNVKESCDFWTPESEKSSCFPRNKSPRSSSSYDEFTQRLSKSFCKSLSPSSSSLSSSSSSPSSSPSLHNKPKKNSSAGSYSSTYQQYYQRRLLRTRKFRLNLFMYANLYRKQRKAETSYEIYHNPMEDPDATYTSFSNPNYFLNRPNTLSTSKNSNNNSEDSASLEKLSLASDASGHYSDYSSCEPTPTTPDRSLILHKLHSADEYDDYDDVDDDGKHDENKSLIESRSSDDSSEETRLNGQREGKGSEPHVYYGIGGLPWSKSKGILGYLEMLEKQAMARTDTDENHKEKTDDDADENEKDNDDDEDDKIAPKASGDGENPNEQRENEKFEHTTEINSPDSNDSGIQPGDKILSPDCPSDIETAKSNDEPQEHKSPTLR